MKSKTNSISSYAFLNSFPLTGTIEEKLMTPVDKSMQETEGKQKQSWFSEWFNSPYYHILYMHRDEREARFFMDNLIQWLHLSMQDKILDVACGRGRHAIDLHARGYEVTGIDIAPDSIHYARQFEHERLHFFVHDMRETFRKNAFDCVLNLFTSFGYFETEAENAGVIRAAAQALRKEGIFVIDFMNTCKIIEGLVPYQIKEVEGIRFEMTRKVENAFIVKDIYFADQGRSYHFQERVKVVTLEDFLHYFDLAGLALLQIFGDYALQPYDTQTSDRLILMAKKI